MNDAHHDCAAVEFKYPPEGHPLACLKVRVGWSGDTTAASRKAAGR